MVRFSAHYEKFVAKSHKYFSGPQYVYSLENGITKPTNSTNRKVLGILLPNRVHTRYLNFSLFLVDSFD